MAQIPAPLTTKKNQVIQAPVFWPSWFKIKNSLFYGSPAPARKSLMLLADLALQNLIG
jgi:hypothetical protein